MLQARLVAQRLIAAFMLGVLLFNFPFLALFNSAAFVLGIPVLPAYLFLVWLGLIALIAFIVERHPN